MAAMTDHAKSEHSAHDMDAHAMMGHTGMSAAQMARDMRNRFFISLIFTLPIFITSHLAELFGLMIPPPFGLSVPVGSVAKIGMSG